jgi:sigma-E factor negative regulatory protein RseA
MRESLSALLDDEADELELERVLRAVGDDHELRATWSRYSAARGAIASGPIAHTGTDISARVSAALRDEVKDKGIQKGVVARMLRPVSSFAVAASVALAVVIGGQQLALVGELPLEETAIAARPSPVGMLNSLGATTVRASYGTQPLPVLQPTTRTAYQKLAQQRMGRYMQEHAEQAALNSHQGLIPFARVPQIRE